MDTKAERDMEINSKEKENRRMEKVRRDSRDTDQRDSHPKEEEKVIAQGLGQMADQYFMVNVMSVGLLDTQRDHALN